MVVALLLPDGALPFQHPIDTVGGGALQSTEDFLERVQRTPVVRQGMVDEMNVVGHDHGAVQMNLAAMIVKAVFKHPLSDRLGQVPAVPRAEGHINGTAGALKVGEPPSIVLRLLPGIRPLHVRFSRAWQLWHSRPQLCVRFSLAWHLWNSRGRLCSDPGQNLCCRDRKIPKAHVELAITFRRPGCRPYGRHPNSRGRLFHIYTLSGAQPRTAVPHF